MGVEMKKQLNTLAMRWNARTDSGGRGSARRGSGLDDVDIAMGGRGEHVPLVQRDAQYEVSRTSPDKHRFSDVYQFRRFFLKFNRKSYGLWHFAPSPSPSVVSTAQLYAMFLSKCIFRLEIEVDITNRSIAINCGTSFGLIRAVGRSDVGHRPH